MSLDSWARLDRPKQGVRRRRLVTETRVRGVRIVVLPPAFDDDPGLGEAVEQLPVQQLVRSLELKLSQ